MNFISRIKFFCLFTCLYNAILYSQTQDFYIAKQLKQHRPINKVNIDTLNIDTVFALQSSIYLYKNSMGGYVFGTNKFGNTKGFTHISQKQLNPLKLNKATEVLIAFGEKKAMNGNSQLKIYLSSIQPAGSTGGTLPNNTQPVEGPGFTMGDTSFLSFSAIDTNSQTMVFTSVPINNVYNLVGDFYVTIDLQDLYNKGDSIGIWADADGDGFLGAHGKYQNKWYQVNTIYQNQLDVNIAIFAIVQDNVGIDENTHHGEFIKMDLQNRHIYVDHIIPGVTEFYWVDATGKIISKGKVGLENFLYIPEELKGFTYLLLKNYEYHWGFKLVIP
ncbi:MAG: hypothetical protein KatS3mg034_1699 [Vicingaceae bacterium]|nr:MAG: hypothetical protein KatS3mg034_1699 [Vicingaceae bacterium]